MTNPEVSIIVTNYNYSRYLSQCIESCINQRTRISYEVIIVDDGSTDNSLEIVRKYLATNVHLLTLRNSGIEAASNSGIKRALGNFIIRVDADDYLMPDHLESVVPIMRPSDFSFAYSDYTVVDSAGTTLYEEKLPAFNTDEIFSRGDFLATGTVYRKAILEKFRYYDESFKNCGLENYCLILKLLKAGNSGLHVPLSLFAYRRHDLNVSLQKREAIIKYGAKIFQELDLGNYRTNAYHPYKLEIING